MTVHPGEIVRVSKESRSKAKGRLVEVVSVRPFCFADSGTEVKVRIIPKVGSTETQFAYVRAKFLERIVPFTEEVESHDGYVCDSNGIHCTTQDIETIDTTDTSHVDVDFKYPLCSPVKIKTIIPFEVVRTDAFSRIHKYETTTMLGWVTDQWVEEGVKLYNVVFLGTYKVFPESAIKGISDERPFLA